MLVHMTTTATRTLHAVYCDGTCTPDQHGCCEITTSYGDAESREDSGTFEVRATYVPDTAVYVAVEGVLYEPEHIDALIAKLLEARDRMEKQEANGF